eukprot:7071336-Prymnesium_polylepis.1
MDMCGVFCCGGSGLHRPVRARSCVIASVRGPRAMHGEGWPCAAWVRVAGVAAWDRPSGRRAPPHCGV